MDYSIKRKLVIDWTKKQLTGKSLPDDKLIGESPLNRFFTGFLFPIVEVEDIFDEEEEINDSDDTDVKPTAKNKRYIPLSFAGFSFFIFYFRRKPLFKSLL